MSLVVLRHGESIWNKENKFTGWIDVDLSEKGRDEALHAGYLLNNYHIDHVITSDLKRTQQTAVLLLQNRPGSLRDHILFHIASEIKERNYGDLAGIVKSELKEKYGDDLMHKWRRSYWEAPPKGENLHDVKERIGPFFDSFVRPLIEKGHNVLMVAHGNSLRALFVHLGFKDENSIEHFELSTATPIQIDFKKRKYHYINSLEMRGLQILDSRGYPTVQVSCYDKNTNKLLGSGSTPSGASCGSNEVLELRDNNASFFKGKSVLQAIDNLKIVNSELSLNYNNFLDLQKIDANLQAIDGTFSKSRLGGNLTTAISFCMANVAAKSKKLELFEFFQQTYGNQQQTFVPTPFVNIINGGKHGVTDDLKIQEFMIFPLESYSADKKVQIVTEVYHTLKDLLVCKYGKCAKSIGDEGGFCPPITNPDEALYVIEQAISESHYTIGVDVFLALDCAASEFYSKETKMYEIEKGVFLSSSELVQWYKGLIERHPALKSIEDAFDEHDYDAWTQLSNECGDKVMIVGDDLFTTNAKLIKEGLKEGWADTLLLKVNQIGTISEAVESAKLMMEKDKQVIVSHRSGETNHAFIIDLAVGIGAKYVKIGSPCRGERVAKFNRLLEIEEIIKKLEKSK